jgi:hypothetical protein
VTASAQTFYTCARFQQAITRETTFNANKQNPRKSMRSQQILGNGMTRRQPSQRSVRSGALKKISKMSQKCDL